jgi:hypothetical protein
MNMMMMIVMMMMMMMIGKLRHFDTGQANSQ